MSLFAFPVKPVAADEATFNTHFRHAMEGRFGGGILSVKPGSTYEYLLLERQTDLRIVAAVKLLTPNEYGEISLRYIETAQDAKGYGYGRRLFSDLFAYAAGIKKTLVLSQYTRCGDAYLRPIEERLARRHASQLQVTHEI